MGTSHVSQEDIEQVIQQEPNADEFAVKVIYVSLAALGFCLLLSWAAPKISVFKTLISWLGGH